jgi:tetratricopeptide (TPR) repeat protein
LIEVNTAAESHTYTLARLPRAFLESLLADNAPLDDTPSSMFVAGHARALAAALTGGDAPADVKFERGAHLLVHAHRFGLGDLAPRLASAVHSAAASAGCWAAWMPVLGALPDHSGDRVTRLVWLGEAQRALGLLDEAQDTLQQALSAAQMQSPLRAAAALELAVVLRLGGLLDRARVTAEGARRAFARLGNADGTAQAVTELAQIELDAGRPAAALHLLDGLGAPPSRRARTTALVGNVLLAQGRVEEALEAHWQALELAQQGEHRPNQARALVNLGRAQLAAGDLIEAEASFEEALGIMTHTRDALGRIRTRANLAVLYAERGHHRRAIDLLNAVLKEQDTFGDGQGASLSRRNLAEIRLRAAETALKRGQTRAAVRHLEAGRALYDQLGLHDQGDAIRRMVSELGASHDVS